MIGNYIFKWTGILLALGLLPLQAYCKRASGSSPGSEKYVLVWSDEFNKDGALDTSVWNFEKGLVRNHEAQYYSPDNAYCKGGVLVLEARKETLRNDSYKPGSENWRQARETVPYTSASINTRGKKSFLYGRLEVRAKIPATKGSWPAIWTLGNEMDWPSCGEFDVMEYYPIYGVPNLLANAAWGTERQGGAEWNSYHIPFEHFSLKDPEWKNKFHIWRMDWDKDFIKVYIDGELIHVTSLKETVNGSPGQHRNPFHTPQYILLNLALGGDRGGPIDDKAFPMRYEIDYVRIYQIKQ